MKITRACDYAMRALISMGRKPKGTVFMRSELSKISNVPDSFLGKIMQNLAKGGILASERGKKGGFRLDKNPEDISMFDVVTAIEGELKISDCIADPDYCNNTSFCKAHQVWRSIQSNLGEQLRAITLNDLL